MAKKKIGLYLGANSVGVAAKDGKNLTSISSFNFSSLEGEKTEYLDENLRWGALIRKTLRDAKVDEKEIYLSLADRDFIVRSVELPLMNKKEIESSLVYEVEKYIPFKAEELVWDYQYTRLAKEKKVNVSFVGIRKSNLDRIKEVLERLELKELAIEPSCISLARLFKTVKEIKNYKNFALLDLTSQETYLTFFQEDLPIFNRYLNMKEKEGDLNLDSFVEGVNFSFQYFHREFKGYNLDKLFILSSEAEIKKAIDSLKENLSLDVLQIFPDSLTFHKNSSVENAKALGAIERDGSPYKFKPVLKSIKESALSGVAAIDSVSWRWGLLSIVGAVVVIIYFIISFIFSNYLGMEKTLLEKKETNLSLPQELQDDGWQNLDPALEKQHQNIRKLKDIKKEKVFFADLLTIFSDRDILPSQLWLDSLRITKRGKKDYSVNITGYIYKGDGYQERSGVNQFAENLKQSPVVNFLFNSVELKSTDKRVIREFDVTEFLIILE